MLQGLKELGSRVRKALHILFPLSNFREKYRNRDKCFFNGSGSVIRNTELEGKNMVGSQVKLNNCEIGYASYINHHSVLNGSKIGRYCSIADNVRSGFGHHPLDSISTHPSFFYDTRTHLGWSWFESDTAPVYDPHRRPNGEDKFITVIGHDVWIGSHAMIMDGVTIGTGAVVGAGSVVTKDVPPYAIVAGVPAKLIRYRYSAEIIKILLASKWWETSDSEMRSILKSFSIEGIHFNSPQRKI